MKFWTHFDPATGEVLGWSSGLDNPGEGYLESPTPEPSYPHTHYVVNNTVQRYTPTQQAAKLGMPDGLTWDNTTMTAVDYRSANQRAADELSQCLTSRANAYPSLVSLADALYWSQRGDNSKMEAYLAQCDMVKAAFPKPNVA